MKIQVTFHPQIPSDELLFRLQKVWNKIFKTIAQRGRDADNYPRIFLDFLKT